MPADIKLTPGLAVHGWFRDATPKGRSSPSLMDVQAVVERLHDLQFWNQRPDSDGQEQAIVDLINRSYSEVQRGVATLCKWLPIMIAIGDQIAEEPPPDPWLIAMFRKLSEERDGEEHANEPPPPGGRRVIFERALAAAERLARELGPPTSRGRPPADWTNAARILAPRIANAWARVDINSSSEHADGPLIMVLAKAVQAATGKVVETEALSSALRRHPALEGI